MRFRRRDALQPALAAGFVAAGATLHWADWDYGLSLTLYFLLAITLGFLTARPWALPLALLPWPLGMGAGLATGRYADLAEAWQWPLLTNALLGACGIAFGLTVRRALERRGG